MRVGIDAFPAMETEGGIGNYVRHLISSLVALDSGDEFIAYVPTRNSSVRPFGESATSSRLIYVGTSRSGLRWRGWLDGLDLYHGTNFKVQTRGRSGSVLTIHDLWLDRYPQYSRKFLGQRLSSFRTRLRARQATRVIADSHHTARDIQEIYGLSPKSVSVVYPGSPSEFFPDRTEGGFAGLSARYGIPARPYLLFIGGAMPRKNLLVLLEAFAQQDQLRKNYYLVVVGGLVHRGKSVIGEGRRLAIQDRVIYTGQVPREDLRALYSHADLFVFPSLYEGFGFPVLEAMACGTPVVASDRTSIPEVAGDAAVLVDPEDASAVAGAMLRVLSDEALREVLRSRGSEQVKKFTWRNTAEETLRVYREACGIR